MKLGAEKLLLREMKNSHDWHICILSVPRLPHMKRAQGALADGAGRGRVCHDSVRIDGSRARGLAALSRGHVLAVGGDD